MGLCIENNQAVCLLNMSRGMLLYLTKDRSIPCSESWSVSEVLSLELSVTIAMREQEITESLSINEILAITLNESNH